MKKRLVNEKVVRAIAVGLSAVMVTASPITALAADGDESLDHKGDSWNEAKNEEKHEDKADAYADAAAKDAGDAKTAAGKAATDAQTAADKAEEAAADAKLVDAAENQIGGLSSAALGATATDGLTDDVNAANALYENATDARENAIEAVKDANASANAAEKAFADAKTAAEEAKKAVEEGKVAGLEAAKAAEDAADAMEAEKKAAEFKKAALEKEVELYEAKVARDEALVEQYTDAIKVTEGNENEGADLTVTINQEEVSVKEASASLAESAQEAQQLVKEDVEKILAKDAWDEEADEIFQEITEKVEEAKTAYENANAMYNASVKTIETAVAEYNAVAVQYGLDRVAYNPKTNTLTKVSPIISTTVLELSAGAINAQNAAFGAYNDETSKISKKLQTIIDTLDQAGADLAKAKQAVADATKAANDAIASADAALSSGNAAIGSAQAAVADANNTITASNTAYEATKQKIADLEKQIKDYEDANKNALNIEDKTKDEIGSHKNEYQESLFKDIMESYYVKENVVGALAKKDTAVTVDKIEWSTDADSRYNYATVTYTYTNKDGEMVTESKYFNYTWETTEDEDQDNRGEVSITIFEKKNYYTDANGNKYEITGATENGDKVDGATVVTREGKTVQIVVDETSGQSTGVSLVKKTGSTVTDSTTGTTTDIKYAYAQTTDKVSYEYRKNADGSYSYYKVVKADVTETETKTVESKDVQAATTGVRTEGAVTTGETYFTTVNVGEATSGTKIGTASGYKAAINAAKDKLPTTTTNAATDAGWSGDYWAQVGDATNGTATTVGGAYTLENGEIDRDANGEAVKTDVTTWDTTYNMQQVQSQEVNNTVVTEGTTTVTATGDVKYKTTLVYTVKGENGSDKDAWDSWAYNRQEAIDGTFAELTQGYTKVADGAGNISYYEKDGELYKVENKLSESSSWDDRYYRVSGTVEMTLVEATKTEAGQAGSYTVKEEEQIRENVSWNEAQQYYGKPGYRVVKGVYQGNGKGKGEQKWNVIQVTNVSYTVSTKISTETGKDLGPVTDDIDTSKYDSTTTSDSKPGDKHCTFVTKQIPVELSNISYIATVGYTAQDTKTTYTRTNTRTDSVTNTQNTVWTNKQTVTSTTNEQTISETKYAAKELTKVTYDKDPNGYKDKDSFNTKTNDDFKAWYGRIKDDYDALTEKRSTETLTAEELSMLLSYKRVLDTTKLNQAKNIRDQITNLNGTIALGTDESLYKTFADKVGVEKKALDGVVNTVVNDTTGAYNVSYSDSQNAISGLLDTLFGKISAVNDIAKVVLGNANDAKAAYDLADAYKGWAVKLSQYEDATSKTFAQLVDDVTVQDNVLGVDTSNDGVVSRPVENYTGNLGEVTIPADQYQALIRYYYEKAGLDQDGLSAKVVRDALKFKKGTGIAAPTTEGEGTLSILFWETDAEGNVTGNYVTGDQLVDGATYFVPYTLKIENDGYHFDGYYYTYVAPRTTPEGGDEGGDAGYQGGMADWYANGIQASVLGANRAGENVPSLATEQAVLGANREGQVLGAVKTGDDTNAMPFLAMMSGAGILGAFSVVTKSRKKKED